MALDASVWNDNGHLTGRSWTQSVIARTADVILRWNGLLIRCGVTCSSRLVEVRGFEPLTPAVRRQCSTGLSYTPVR